MLKNKINIKELLKDIDSVFDILNEIESVESLDDKKIDQLSKKAKELEKDIKNKYPNPENLDSKE